MLSAEREPRDRPRDVAVVSRVPTVVQLRGENEVRAGEAGWGGLQHKTRQMLNNIDYTDTRGTVPLLILTWSLSPALMALQLDNSRNYALLRCPICVELGGPEVFTARRHNLGTCQL
ncbi:hypothetical protein J6590_026716 [Homalodisca vitripennis]|nr:hypothetical protein J6590_026716 [Homalodisca vitripennis]